MFLDFTKYQSFIVLAILCCCYSCIPVEEILPDKNDNGIFSCNLNGELFEAEGGKGILSNELIIADLEESEDSFLLTVFGVNIVEDGAGLAVGFKIGGKQLNELKPGEVGAWTLIEGEEDVFQGTMGGVEKRSSINSDEYEFRASSNNSGNITLTLTEVDLENQTISGVFEFTAMDDESGEKFTVTDGEFSQVKWNLK